MLLAYFVVALATQRPPAVVQHFRSVATESIPGSLVAKICSDRDESDCAETFRTNGRAWTGDINDDAASEYVIFDGQLCGTLGCSYDLFEIHAEKWNAIPVFMSGSDPDVPLWISNRPRFDILPIVRDGYHDLRIAVDECVKWNGHEYVAYQPDDYRRLSPSLFNQTDNHEAEIFWMIRYAGLSEFAFNTAVVPNFARRVFAPAGRLDVIGRNAYRASQSTSLAFERIHREPFVGRPQPRWSLGYSQQPRIPPGSAASIPWCSESSVSR